MTAPDLAQRSRAAVWHPCKQKPGNPSTLMKKLFLTFAALGGIGLAGEPTLSPKWLVPGDRVKMEISGVGVLENTVADEPRS